MDRDSVVDNDDINSIASSSSSLSSERSVRRRSRVFCVGRNDSGVSGIYLTPLCLGRPSVKVGQPARGRSSSGMRMTGASGNKNNSVPPIVFL